MGRTFAHSSFEPHRTHQNGLSVDFMVPVRDASPTIAELPTSALQKFGDALEFGAAGSLGELRIDFEAIALQLAALKRAAASRRVGIARVSFDPKLRLRLTRTNPCRLLSEEVRCRLTVFNRRA